MFCIPNKHIITITIRLLFRLRYNDSFMEISFESEMVHILFIVLILWHLHWSFNLLLFKLYEPALPQHEQVIQPNWHQPERVMYELFPLPTVPEKRSQAFMAFSIGRFLVAFIAELPIAPNVSTAAQS